MKLPAFVGRSIYFFGYPIFRILIKNTHRAYVVVIYKNKILVTKNWLGNQKKWRLPGGGIKRSERPAAAACRELFEELGIRLTEQDVIQLNPTPIEAPYGYLIELFTAPTTKTPKIAIDEREILAAKFMSKNELTGQAMGEELQAALRLLHW